MEFAVILQWIYYYVLLSKRSSSDGKFTSSQGSFFSFAELSKDYKVNSYYGQKSVSTTSTHLSTTKKTAEKTANNTSST